MHSEKKAFLLMKKFTDFPLHAEILSTLDKLGFTEPTEIQEKSLPLLLETENNDVHGQAQTGTGKTLAFGLPLIQHIQPENKQTQALIVAPTRELAIQSSQSLEPVTKARNISMSVVYGGVSIDRQLRELRNGAQIVIGTPGRLNDHLRRRSLSLKTTRTLVLDEADIMLDMGFKQEIDEILNYTPENRNIWLFSATVKRGISDLMRSHMNNPISICVSKHSVGSTTTKQYYCTVPRRHRSEALFRFISSTPDFYGFIFCQTKIETAELADRLAAKGYSANALHGDMNQANRLRVIDGFKKGKFKILVATDVAARGIDVSDATHVINYQLPDDHESYVHRVGRTGRAGKKGISITFVGNREQSILKSLQKRFNITIEPIEVPSLDNVYEQQIQNAGTFIESAPEEKTAQHLNKLQSFLAQYSENQINNALLALLDDKFFKVITKNDIDFSKTSHFEQRYHDDSVAELMLNVGTMDGIEKRDILQQLMKSKAINKKHIGNIRVIKKRSFIKVAPNIANDIIDALRKTVIKGRKVFVTTVQ